MDYRASITSTRNARHLVIERVDVLGATEHRVARIRLTGGPNQRGTWDEVTKYLSDRGFTAKRWSILRSAGEVRSMLTVVEPEPEPEPEP
ncbi:hypothetical protein SAMN04487819_1411, partial [Actinopolyspora alba]